MSLRRYEYRTKSLIALDRFPERWLSISVTIWLTVMPRDVAIAFNSVQKAFSNDTLV